VLRLPPAASRLEAVESALSELAGAGGSVLVLVPERPAAETLARLLRRRGHAVALQPEDWPAVAAAHDRIVVVGVRGAAFAPAPLLRGVVVLDAHAESYIESHAPTWNAFVVAAERARRAGVPCLATSPCPAPEQLVWGDLVVLGRREERAGWPVVEVIDRRSEDPRSRLYSPRLAGLIRTAVRDGRTGAPRGPVLCVLNRTGRAKLLACASCGELVRCERCGAAEALRSPRAREGAGAAGGTGVRSADAVLACPGCGASRLPRCLACGSTRLKNLRPGVGRVREELAALTGLRVGEVTASSRPPAGGAEPNAPVIVGTEAVLHRARTSSLVVFLDFDQELLASRMRANEHALGLLALAGRIVGGRNEGRGRIVVQTRLPDNDVLAAAVHGDPDRASVPEVERRRLLGLPPFRAVASISGPGALAFVEALRARAGDAVEVGGEHGDRFLARAPSETLLADALAVARQAADALAAPARPTRIEVDPLAL
jgi:primosomal protein N' (replication factor Y)